MKKRKPAASAARPQKKKAVQRPLAEQARLAADEISQSAAFRRATADAEEYAGDPTRLRKLVEDAVGKINTVPRGPFAGHRPRNRLLGTFERSVPRGAITA